VGASPTGHFGVQIRGELRYDLGLRRWIKHSTLDCSDNGSTVVKLKRNPSPTRTVSMVYFLKNGFKIRKVLLGPCEAAGRIVTIAANRDPDGVDGDKRTIGSWAPDPQHERAARRSRIRITAFGSGPPAIRGFGRSKRHPGRPECADTVL
jgi:hypothetical protein